MPVFFGGGIRGGGGMLVVPHRIAAGQRFGLGSGPAGHNVEPSGRVLPPGLGHKVLVTELKWLRVLFKEKFNFSVCAMLANVSSLTNNTLASSEAASIIKKAGCLHMFCGLGLVFKGLTWVRTWF